MFSKSYVLDPRPRFPFRVVAKRYWIKESPEIDDHDASSATSGDVFTLVFIHGIGTHKEQWEPTMERLFMNQQANPASLQFHDMWAIDLLNHGDAAVLNEEELRSGYNTFSWEYHARAVHAFLSKQGAGGNVDLSERSFVFVGHSMGAIVAMLASMYYPLLDVSSLHLVEPALLGDHAPTLSISLTEKAETRRDIWSSRNDALQALKGRSKWKVWDERVLKTFIEHGLRPLPTAEYPDIMKGVTLKATKRQEAANSRDHNSCTIAYKLLPYLLKERPTHIVYGTVMDFIPYELQEKVLHVVSGGISNFASVTRVNGAGHMIIQTHPDSVADIIWKSLICKCTAKGRL